MSLTPEREKEIRELIPTGMYPDQADLIAALDQERAVAKHNGMVSISLRKELTDAQAALERAQADNAAQRLSLAKIAHNAHGYGAEWDYTPEEMLTKAQASVLALKRMVQEALAADHPGAALLAELVAAQRCAKAFEDAMSRVAGAMEGWLITLSGRVGAPDAETFDFLRERIDDELIRLRDAYGAAKAGASQGVS